MTTALNQYRLLGRSGLRVSPLCLGTMTFGTEWGTGSTKEESRKIFDTYAGLGGNFIDTANFYTGGTSEKFTGDFLKGRRDQFVLATKYTLNMESGNPNAGGNHRKCIKSAVDASLKRLQTDYIDLYWLHAWEYRTPVEEVMRALDDLVRQGKILYAAVSDTPAWKIAEANTLANLRGWTPFIANQIHYNLVERTSEHEQIPMSRELDIGVMPWSPLAGGVLSGKYTSSDLEGENKPGTRMEWLKLLGQLTARSLRVVDGVNEIAKKKDKSASQISLRWLIQKPGVTSIIIGARKIEQLEENLSVLEFELAQDEMEELDRVSQIDPIFPGSFSQGTIFRNNVDGGAQIEAGFEVNKRRNEYLHTKKILSRAGS